MPTVGIYVPISVARRVAQRFGVRVGDEDFLEVVRGISAEALEDAAGLDGGQRDFNTACLNKHLHRAGHRCRNCGGSQ